MQLWLGRIETFRLRLCMLGAPVVPRAALQHSGFCRHSSGWAARCMFSAQSRAVTRGAPVSGAMGPARDLVPEIHLTPLQAVVYATGGGMQASVISSSRLIVSADLHRPAALSSLLQLRLSLPAGHRVASDSSRSFTYRAGGACTICHLSCGRAPWQGACQLC